MLIFLNVVKGLSLYGGGLVDIGGNRWGVSELLQAVYYKPVMYPLRFCRSFEFKYFWFPRFGRTETPMGWAFVVSDGESVTSYRSHYKVRRCCYGFATVFNVFLITSTFWGK